MLELKDIVRGSRVRGIVPEQTVVILDTRWFGGNSALEVTYRTEKGQTESEVLYPYQQEQLNLEPETRSWDVTLDGSRLQLAAEATRIRLAYLFDPRLAVHISSVEPLPHQITAVYEEMLTRQPLRFLLADDPGAGKTIMAGLFLRELVARGDLRRALIISPGSLVEQWQDELYTRFNLVFDIMTNDKLTASPTGNWLGETPLVIARLDKLSRDEEVQRRLEQTEWDVIVVDEAHKMSATFFGNEIKYTKRYHLGRMLGNLTRHLLLLTATPHNGYPEDFQLFMALLDPDRFEGKPRPGEAQPDATDLMRRLTKEQLLKFDGRRLFPERLAHAVPYDLSRDEAQLYEDVTEYVRQEFNRAEALESGGQRGTVGFALTVLQRRLASSPEAIYQSLRRRRDRLKRRLQAERLKNPSVQNLSQLETPLEVIEDEDDVPEAELVQAENTVVDQATAAQTIAELEAEIFTLTRLEALALQVRRSGRDRKWEELSGLLQERPEMRDATGSRRKLVIFTEHRDTLNYLQERIGVLLGRPETVVAIHGAVSRDDRRAAQVAFTDDPQVLVLIATDAAGEGINLQRAHLMVNYDLPWNPNRLEQRFGRIHRIGQTEVCHLWNLIARNTREGEVFEQLFHKLERERQALGGRVFDVLGRLTFNNMPLRDLLVEAIRYGNQPERRAWLEQIVDSSLNRDHLRALLEERSLARDSLDMGKVQTIRAEMERAEARRLQPFYIGKFFLDAFPQLGGTVYERESGRYEIRHLPQRIRERAAQMNTRLPVLERYERIAFDKERVRLEGRPQATFVSPGHPLLDVVGQMILERDGELLRRGAVLVDDHDLGTTPRTLYALEHLIEDGRRDAQGGRRVISRQLHFIEIPVGGSPQPAGYAPHLDYRPLTEAEQPPVSAWLKQHPHLAPGASLEQATEFAVVELMPAHFKEVRERKEDLIRRTRLAVRERLTREIAYWDSRANQIRAQEEAGKKPKLNSKKARDRADYLEQRLKTRMLELEEESKLSQRPPVVMAEVLIVPRGLLLQLTHQPLSQADLVARQTAEIEHLAMEAVMENERRLGHVPRDVSRSKLGYDIESEIVTGEHKGRLRFIEVKGRVEGATSITVTRNEVLVSLNKAEQFILAVVQVGADKDQIHYLHRPFQRELTDEELSTNLELKRLLARAERQN
ncbi:DUF3883 domain-containing protein [uncultured Meiothermus sp.]|uniref:protein NO VEIN domain-containing protein n=1 Tax=uncultured Meiothermus sp. TaxID=157471 RepID=UPI0026170B6C|nr:DUF3883 domain-containing protein [uncultured Meiothermus sp.]